MKHCATSQKGAGSISEEVIRNFQCLKLSGRTMALGSTQSGGKGGRNIRLTNLPTSFADCLEIGEPEPPGTLEDSPGVCTDCSTFDKPVYVGRFSPFYTLRRPLG